MFVLDASVALSWCFPDELNAYADKVLRYFKADRASVPSIWSLEVANALLVGRKRGRMNQEQLQIALSLLSELKISVDVVTPAHVFRHTVPLALGNDLTAYDTAYLELAQRLGCPLATADQRLYQAAQRIGVHIF